MSDILLNLGNQVQKGDTETVKELVNRYEKQLADAPIGKSFTECYDPVEVAPTDEYLQLWDDCRKSL